MTDLRVGQFKRLALGLGVSAAMISSAQAQTSDQQTIDELRAQLDQMQQRIEQLERGQSSGASQPMASNQSGWNQSGSSQNDSPQNNVSQDAYGEGTDTGTSANGDQPNSNQQSLAQQNQATLEEMQQVEIGGLLEFSGSVNDWDSQSKDTAGDLDFGKFIVTVQGESGQIDYSLAYRFYDDYHFLQHGWVGYNPTEQDSFKLGLVQTPFGNMDYGYLGYYGNLAYLAGFNDNQNAGIKWDHSEGPWDTSLAFFKSDNLGNGNEHYGANAIGDSAQGNSEENQVAARVGYTFGHDTDFATQVNLSAKGGQLYNRNTERSGDNWSAALGVDGSYGNWRTLAQATTYEYNAKNPAESESGISDNALQIGAFNFNYLIPAKGEIYSASVGYNMEVEWGPVDNLFFFNDFSVIDPSGDFTAINGGFGNQNNPMVNDLGVQMTAGPFFAWFDIVSNKNGLDYFGAPVDDGWNTAFLTNFGIEF
ncbi:hypothetical protein ACGK9R_10235 [Halomonas sp. HNIBRBA4712]|uniref:hypothetical protein n=1 Tax=Halomonas sp. HNIBRBA4712 TaxID=3373087 RepID=UPI0037452F19